MEELFQTLVQLIFILATLVVQLLALALQWALLVVWLAWAFLGINWKKMWPTLAAGAWIPAVLLVVLAAIVWAALQPISSPIPGFRYVPNFWWQLAIISGIAALTLFLGWLQDVVGWQPPEIAIEPPAAVEHGHAHH